MCAFGTLVFSRANRSRLASRPPTSEAPLLTGLALSAGAQWAVPLFVPVYVEWVGLGYIVPGLLAHQFDRQGVLPTLLMLAIAAPLVRLIVVLAVRL